MEKKTICPQCNKEHSRINFKYCSAICLDIHRLGSVSEVIESRKKKELLVI
jgi:hypothetical protein